MQSKPQGSIPHPEELTPPHLDGRVCVPTIDRASNAGTYVPFRHLQHRPWGKGDGLKDRLTLQAK